MKKQKSKIPNLGEGRPDTPKTTLYEPLSVVTRGDVLKCKKRQNFDKYQNRIF